MNPKPILYILFITLWGTMISCAAHAQQDSTHPQRIPIKPTTDFDQRFFYFQNRWANTWGYRIGILVHDKFKTGIGGYYMDEDISISPINAAFARTSGPLQQDQKMYLGTLYYEPYLLRKKLWETSVVFETGYGRTVNTLTDKATGQILSSENNYFIPLGVGLSFNLKLPPLFQITPIRWLGINFITGYRKGLFQGDGKYNYDGPFWSLSGAIFLDRVVEDINRWKFHKRKISERTIQLSY